MQWTGWIGLAVGLVAVVGSKLGPPPVILDLGPVTATPAPTPKSAQKKRLITTVTVQNSPAGESVVSFEATDFADEGKDKTRVLASKRYSLAEEKPELRELRDRIVEQIRALEHEMLAYVEKAGPPKARAPIGRSEGGPGAARPYR
jgi:hypothetical protein